MPFLEYETSKTAFLFSFCHYLPEAKTKIYRKDKNMARTKKEVPSVDELLNTAQESEKKTEAAEEKVEEVKEPVASEEIKEVEAAAEEKPEPRREPGRASRNMNKVTITGVVRRVTHNKQMTTAVMRVKSQATVTTAYFPTVYFFGAALAQLASEFEEGDRVKVEGTIQSYPKETLKKGQEEVILVGTSVQHEENVEPEVYDEEGLRPIEGVVRGDVNRIDLRGRIEKIECRRNDDVRITIRTVRNGRPCIVEYPYVARNTDRFLSNVHVHQYVGAVGTIQTAMVPTDIEAETTAEATADATLRRTGARPYVRTRSQQVFILYDLYALDPVKR